MYDNEFSCYFLNSSGQHIIHGSIYIILKILLILLINTLCHKRIKSIETEIRAKKEKKKLKVRIQKGENISDSMLEKSNLEG